MGKLVRRTIRTILKQEYGSAVNSLVSGAIDVQVPPRTDEVRFRDEILSLLRDQGHEPSAAIIPHTGSRWVRITTPETRAQRGQGGHKR